MTWSPDAALLDDYAATNVLCGMFNGWFTGYALKNFIGDPSKGQMVSQYDTRQIINGFDRAGVIVDYANTFATAL